MSNWNETIRWKQSADWFCFSDPVEITHEKAISLLEECGLKHCIKTVELQHLAHRSGTIKTSEDTFLHYMSK